MEKKLQIILRILFLKKINKSFFSNKFKTSILTYCVPYKMNIYHTLEILNLLTHWPKETQLFSKSNSSPLGSFCLLSAVAHLV